MKKPIRRNFKKESGKGPPTALRPRGRSPAPREEASAASGRPKGPPESTFRETQHLKSLVANKAKVRVRLRDNETLEGVVEYYDTNFIRLTRRGEPNLFIYKSDIKFLEERG